MKPIQLDKKIPIPLYFQLKQYLEQEIIRGVWKPGDLLPSEREMSEGYGISRMTVRQALVELVNEGKLIREQGKGTFVAERKGGQGILHLTSFSEHMRSRGLRPSTQVLESEWIVATPQLSHAFQLSEGSTILKLRRLRFADGVPMAIERTQLPLNRFPKAATQDFTQISLYKWLESTYDVVVSHAKQTIEAAMPKVEEAELLQIPLTAPVLVIERTTLDQRQQTIEMTRSVYRGDLYKLTQELNRS